MARAKHCRGRMMGENPASLSPRRSSGPIRTEPRARVRKQGQNRPESSQFGGMTKPDQFIQKYSYGDQIVDAVFEGAKKVGDVQWGKALDA